MNWASSKGPKVISLFGEDFEKNKSSVCLGNSVVQSGGSWHKPQRGQGKSKHEEEGKIVLQVAQVLLALPLILHSFGNLHDIVSTRLWSVGLDSSWGSASWMAWRLLVYRSHSCSGNVLHEASDSVYGGNLKGREKMSKCCHQGRMYHFNKFLDTSLQREWLRKESVGVSTNKVLSLSWYLIWFEGWPKILPPPGIPLPYPSIAKSNHEKQLHFILLLAPFS